MKTRENQRVVTTMKTICDANHKYAVINIEAMKRAMNKLKPNTFKLWQYLAKNQDKYTFALSKTDVMDFCNMSRNTYLAAVNELVDTGYLIQDKDGSNHYNFYEVPPEELEDFTITINKVG